MQQVLITTSSKEREAVGMVRTGFTELDGPPDGFEDHGIVGGHTRCSSQFWLNDD